jgi:hypothetical protein
MPRGAYFNVRLSCSERDSPTQRHEFKAYDHAIVQRSKPAGPLPPSSSVRTRDRVTNVTLHPEPRDFKTQAEFSDGRIGVSRLESCRLEEQVDPLWRMRSQNELRRTRIGHSHHRKTAGAQDSRHLSDGRLNIIDVLEHVAREGGIVQAVLNSIQSRNAFLKLSVDIRMTHHSQVNVNPINAKCPTRVCEPRFNPGRRSGTKIDQTCFRAFPVDCLNLTRQQAQQLVAGGTSAIWPHHFRLRPGMPCQSPDSKSSSFSTQGPHQRTSPRVRPIDEGRVAEPPWRQRRRADARRISPGNRQANTGRVVAIRLPTRFGCCSSL